jgi:hypothetical protein
MSYTLYLWAQDGSALHCERLVELFGTDCFADMDEDADDGGAESTDDLFYENDQTGVYFQISNVSKEDAEDEQGTPMLKQDGICIDLNLSRPTPFALETAEFIDALHEEIPLVVWDSQLTDEKVPPYDREVFLANWMIVNHTSYRAIGGMDPNFKDRPVLSSDAILDHWNWNYFRPELNDEITEDVYVPRFYLAKTDEGVISVPMWPNKLPVCLPETEWILLNRGETLLSEAAKKEGEEIELTLVRRSEIQHILDPYKLREFRGTKYRYLNYASPDKAPAAIDDLFRNRSFDDNFEPWSLDGVIDGTFFEDNAIKTR